MQECGSKISNIYSVQEQNSEYYNIIRNGSIMNKTDFNLKK